MLDVCAAALTKMIDALEKLDKANAPVDIGAHLDLAICRLEEFLNSEKGQITMGADETIAK